MKIEKGSILIATLGSEPQVVSCTYTLLLKQGYKFSKVIIIHTSPKTPIISQALSRLQNEFQFKVPVEYLTISENDQQLEDVDTPQAARAFFTLLYKQMIAIKQHNKNIHLSIAGGRKTMAVFGMAAAQLVFEDEDHLWHLFSAGEYLQSKNLVPTETDVVHLVEIPVLKWSQVLPAAWELQEFDDPYLAIKRIDQLQLNEKIEAGRVFFLGSLSPAEQPVVQLLVENGFTDQQIASELSLSHHTVETHLRSAYRKAAAHWDLVEVNRSQLIALLNIYFMNKVHGNP